jgi:hypothetical protein
MKSYLQVAGDVLINAGVAKLNPDYDPNELFSQEIIITAPERLCSYDEPKIELDCTKVGKGNTNRTIRNGPEDDNTAIITKLDKRGSTFCGRLGDGRALPVFIDFKPGDSFEPSWASHYVSDDILDDERKQLAWRCNINAKGSVNEEFRCLYVKEILYPALGYPKHRDNVPGQQGDNICEGVGTHIAILCGVRLWIWDSKLWCGCRTSTSR